MIIQSLTDSRFPAACLALGHMSRTNGGDEIAPVLHYLCDSRSVRGGDDTTSAPGFVQFTTRREKEAKIARVDTLVSEICKLERVHGGDVGDNWFVLNLFHGTRTTKLAAGKSNRHLRLLDVLSSLLESSSSSSINLKFRARLHTHI